MSSPREPFPVPFPTLQLPLPLSEAREYAEYQPGQLHGIQTSLDHYLQIPYVSGDHYDLVDGCLIWREVEMTDLHDSTRDSFAEYLKRGILEAGLENKLEVLVERTVYIEPRRLRSHTRQAGKVAPLTDSGAHGVRRSDIIVKRRDLEPVRHKLSPNSQKITSPRGHPSEMIVEITSSNSEADTIHKWEEYYRSNVKEYVIVHRTVNRAGSPHIIVGFRDSDEGHGEYRKKFYYGNDKVLCSFIRELNLTAKALLRPRPATEIALSPLRRARSEIAERDKKIEERDKKIEEQAKLIAKLASEMDKSKLISTRISTPVRSAPGGDLQEDGRQDRRVKNVLTAGAQAKQPQVGKEGAQVGRTNIE